MFLSRFTIINNSTAAFMKRNTAFLIYLALAIVAIFIMFRDGLLIFNDDSAFQLNLKYALYHYSYAFYYGPSSSQYMVGIVFFWDIIYLLTNSLFWVEVIFITCLFILIGLGTIILSRILLGRRFFLVEMVVSFFYLFNFYSISVIWDSFQLRTVFYALLPLLTAIFLISINTNDYRKRWIFLLVISILAGLTGPYPLPILIIVFIFTTFVVYQRGKFKMYVKTWLIFLALLVLTNLYYLISLVSSFGGIISVHSVAEPSYLFFSYPRAENLLNSIRLLGYEFIWYWGWGVPNYPWSVEVTTSSVFLVSTLILPIFLPISLILGRKRGRKIPILLMLLFGVLISSAGSKPFGIYVFKLLNFLHLVQIYEIPFEIFAVVIVFSYILFLIVSTSDFFCESRRSNFILSSILDYADAYDLLKRKANSLSSMGSLDKSSNYKSVLKKELRIFNSLIRAKLKKARLYYTKFGSIIFLTILISVSVNTYPVWNGQLVPSAIRTPNNGLIVPSAHIAIPSYYSSFNNYARLLNHNYSLLVLPPYSPASHVWNPNNETATNPLIEYYSGGLNIINFDNVGDSSFVNLVNDLIANNTSAETFTNIMSHFSVKYILFEKDWLNLLYYQEPLSFYLDYLHVLTNGTGKSVSILWESGKLELIGIDLPHVSTIVQPIKFGYESNFSYNQISDFYSFPATDNYSLIPFYNSSFNYTNSAYPLNFATTKLDNNLKDLRVGNYGLYASGFCNNYLGYPVKDSGIGFNYSGNESPLKVYNLTLPQIKGINPLTFINVTNSSSGEITPYYLNNTYTVLNQYDLVDALGLGHNNSTNNQTNIKPGLSVTINKSIPRNFTLSLTLSVNNNVTEVSYGGLFIHSNTGNRTFGIIVRQGPQQTEGGILLTDYYGLNYSNVSYANIPVPQNNTYDIVVKSTGTLLSVFLNGNRIIFSRGGITLPNGGQITIPQVYDYNSVTFQSFDLPFQISGFNLTFQQFTIDKVLALQIPNDSGTSIYSDYALTYKSPTSYNLKIFGNISDIYIAYYGSGIDGWVVENHNEFWPYEQKYGSVYNSITDYTTYGEFYYVSFNSNITQKTFFIEYIPQTYANVGSSISIGTVIAVSVLFLLSWRTRIKDKKKKDFYVEEGSEKNE